MDPNSIHLSVAKVSNTVYHMYCMIGRKQYCVPILVLEVDIDAMSTTSKSVEVGWPTNSYELGPDIVATRVARIWRYWIDASDPITDWRRAIILVG